MSYIRHFLAWIGSFFLYLVRDDIDDLRHKLVDTRKMLEDGLNIIDARYANRNLIPKPVFVVLMSPAGMMSERVLVSKDVTTTIRFAPMGPIPKGAWISIIGDGYITDVTVGNMAQLLSVSTGMPFCITQSDAEVGNYITVRVKGNES